MRFGSLLAGIGGIDLGLERAGMECAWQVEVDPYCQRVLKKHWPDVPLYGDIKELDLDGLERVDLVAGGFPCQPVSQAGKRRAQEDERWLWPEFARVLRALRPRYALLENVPGLLRLGPSDVQSDLADLGYDTDWDCIPAAFVGAPHRRSRIFLVAHAVGQQLRVQPGGSGRSGGTRPAVVAAHGTSRDVAHTTVAERNGAEQQGVAPAVFRASEPRERGRSDGPGDGWWRAEPDVGRVAYGVPDRLDRLRALGNAVVPQVAEHVGRLIMEHAHGAEDRG